MVIITDAKGRIQWVNPSFTRVTEYTQEEVIGKNPGRLLQGQKTDRRAGRLVRAALWEGRSARVEMLNYTKYGRTFWVDLNIQPIFDATGKVERYIAIESDITERKQVEDALKESREHLSQIVEGNSICHLRS